MADKYLYHDSATGRTTEKAAVAASAGVGDAGKIVALNASGAIDDTMLPAGIGADAQSIVAYENLSAGDFVAVFSDSGTLKVRKASAASGGLPANGFVTNNVTAPASATVYFDGRNTALSGQTIGTDLYLSDATPGAVTATPVTGSGKLHQRLGRALSATSATTEIGEAIVLA